MSQGETTTRNRLYRCSFCGKSQVEVKTLVSGPGVFICDECLELAQAVVDNKQKPAKSDKPNPLLPDNAPTEALLNTLEGYNGAFERIEDAMKDVVDILRERDISWAAIGGVLNMTRQAAWKRFG
jgi:hypothetical protein